MKKKIVTLVLAAVMVLAMAIPAFAADINTEEAQVLDSWTAVVTNWNEVQGVLKDNVASQYIQEATNAMMKVDLPAGAAEDICNNAIGKADQAVAGCKSQTELKGKLSTVLGIVNPVLAKYGMSISVDTSTGYATVTVTTADGQQDKAGDNRPAVKQTGEASMAGTVSVVGLIVAAAVAGIIVVNKKRLTER